MNNNKKEVSGLGITALIFGIIGLIVLPIFLGIIALLFGLGSMKEDSLGTAGVVLGIIDITFGIIMISYYF